jgi:hypothetical protein
MTESISGIFLDFDNIFSSLYEQDAGIAEDFANSPARWLDAMATMLGGERRRWVVRRCYMNPSGRIHKPGMKESVWFSHFRQNFVRDGWEVIDTPPLTKRGKTSADIHIVMDVMDSVTAYPHVYEYMIMAADADYTPLVIRLRKHMKRTIIYFVDEKTSSAYRAACDAELGQSSIIELYKKPATEPLAASAMTPERAKEIVLRYFSESAPGFQANSGYIGHMLAEQGFDVKKAGHKNLSAFLTTVCGLTVEPGPNGKAWIESDPDPKETLSAKGN